MKINKIKTKLTEGLFLFECDNLTNVLTQNIREAVLHDDKDEDNIDDLESGENVDDELVVKPVNIDKVKPEVNVNGVDGVEVDIEKPVGTSPRGRMAQPITDPKIINKKPQVKPINMVGDASEVLTAKDKGLKLGNSDTDIKRIIDSNMMVKIKYKSNSRGESNTYNVAIYALGTNIKGNRAIRVYNSFGGSGESKSGWKTFLVGNIDNITVSGQHMGKAAISDYLTNTPKPTTDPNKKNEPEVQGYNHYGDKSFKTIDYQKTINNGFNNVKI